jgi:hypothetical protein
MTGPLTAGDREHFWAQTQEFFDDVDREDSGAGLAAHPDDPGALVDHPDVNDTPPTGDPGEQPPIRLPKPGGQSSSSQPPRNGGDTAHTGHNGCETSEESRCSAVELAPADVYSAEPPQRSGGDDGRNDVHTDADPAAPPAPDAPEVPTAQPTSAELALTDTKETETKPPAAARYNKKIAAGFVAATALAALVASGALMVMRTEPHVAETDHTAGLTTQISVVAAPTTTAGAGDRDAAIPYTATSVGCLPGSTAAQAAASPDPTQAWVCVTGGNAGQYVVLNLGRSMLINAVSLTPGWVGTDTSGADQWHQHRVATRVQWSFNDSPPTVIAQDTGSVHGEATKALPERGVLASRVILLIQETARAPADAAPTTSPAPTSSGLFDDILGPPATEPPPPGSAGAMPGVTGDQARTDPADNSFAISSIKIFGHPPQ